MTELTMTLKEADRLAVLKKLANKDLELGRVAEEIGISYRQMKRLWRRYKEKGAKGLVSLRRGRPSPNRMPKDLQDKALKLVQTHYANYGPTLAAEKLKEKHKLELSRETLRQLMIGAGLWKGKKLRKVKAHPRRARRSRFGEMEQIDGSYEYWFEDRAEKCCLIVFVDDATSRITLMRFCRTETSEDYLQLLRMYLELYGRPLAIYSDKHSIFRVTRKERLGCGKWTTRFHEVLKGLEIELICAHSPQAKGRVERAHGTLQDRLIKEMTERKISSIEEGNLFLDEFTETYNKKFAKSPASTEDAHRAVLPSQNLERMFMLKTERTVSRNLSFQHKNEIYQVDTNRVHTMYGKKVEVYESGGEIKLILMNGRPLKCRKWKDQIAEPARVLDAKELEITWPDKKQYKPGKHHRWRS